MSLAEKLLEEAIRKGVMIATAESCTAGMISAAITDAAGSSEIFDRGFVTYTNNAKQEMLGVTGDTLEKFGAVSEQTACEMAEGALKRSNAQMAIAVSGIAGPGGSEFKPEGRVCFALASTFMPTRFETIEFGSIGRANVRAGTVSRALEILLMALSTLPPNRAKTEFSPNI